MLIKSRNLFYVNKRPVSADFELTKGITLLTGDNGVGKTSFFNYLKESKSEFFKEATFAFMDQFPLMTINEIRLCDVLKLVSDTDFFFDTNLLSKLLDRYNLNYLLERPVRLYSGGENQLVKFLLMISQNVDYYFLDEPLHYIDQERLILLKEDLIKLAKDKVILVIEHRSHEIEALNPKLLKMKNTSKGVQISGY